LCLLSLSTGAGGDTIAAAAREAGVGVEPTVGLADAAEALGPSARAGLVFVTNHWADAAAWCLTGVGFAAAVLATLRQATPRSPALLDAPA
jgi:hypothetical protein